MIRLFGERRKPVRGNVSSYGLSQFSASLWADASSEYIKSSMHGFVVRHTELSPVVQGRMFRCRNDPVTAPENTVAPGGRALFFTGVPYACARVVFVSRNEVERHLEEAIERLTLGTHEVELVATVEGNKV